MSVVFRSKTQEIEIVSNKKPPQDILDILPTPLKEIFIETWDEEKGIEEIRLRKKRPLIFRLAKREIFFHDLIVSNELFDSVLRIISKNSIYALENEFRNGFITIRGGHRVGFAGEAVIERDMIKTQKNLASLNIRIARAVIGCGAEILPYIIDTLNKSLKYTLIVSPPRCGKTTLLRDLVRSVSSGVGKYNLPPMQVGLVDERSEIAGCYQGIPQLDVGQRTDVLDRCPKDQGMIMLVRSMGPEVIATDELGGSKDVEAVRQIANAGIKFIATVHGDSYEQLTKRPYLKELLAMGIFQRYIFLNKFGAGTWVKDILNGQGKSVVEMGFANDFSAPVSSVQWPEFPPQ